MRCFTRCVLSWLRSLAPLVVVVVVGPFVACTTEDEAAGPSGTERPVAASDDAASGRAIDAASGSSGDAATLGTATADAAPSDAAPSGAGDAAKTDASSLKDASVKDVATTTSDAGKGGTADAGASYATAFATDESPISEGGVWVRGKTDGVDWNDPKVSGGNACASVLSGNPNRYNDSIAHLSGSFAADQFAEGVVYRAAGYDPSPSKHEVELLLRFQIAPNDARGYEIMWGVTGYLAVVRWNGPLGDYTPLYDPGDPGIGPAVDGDVLRAEIHGGTITVHKNGALVATIDVTAAGNVWSNGKPGIGFWPVDGATPESYGWKSYQAGSF